MKRMVSLLLAVVLLAGCHSVRVLPNPDLSKQKYKIIANSQSAVRYGFRLLGILPFSNPTRMEVESDLLSRQSNPNNDTLLIINKVEESKGNYFVLFSVNEVRVSGDIIAIKQD